MNAFQLEEQFQVIFEDKPVQVETLYMGKDTMYLARLANQQPLVLTRAKDANATRFWTSVPEGRQELAEAIGDLIADHIKKTW